MCTLWKLCISKIWKKCKSYLIWAVLTETTFSITRCNGRKFQILCLLVLNQDYLMSLKICNSVTRLLTLLTCSEVTGIGSLCTIPYSTSMRLICYYNGLIREEKRPMGICFTSVLHKTVSVIWYVLHKPLHVINCILFCRSHIYNLRRVHEKLRFL